MKVCTRCSVEKLPNEFSKRKDAKDGLQGRCKQCSNQTVTEWQKNNKDKANKSTAKWRNNNQEYFKQYYGEYYKAKHLPYWIVYQLPNANNYVGQTNVPEYRMNHHKFMGRNTDNWIELGRCNTLQEALALEAHYHSLGYPGDNANYNRNKTQLETL